MRPISLTLIKPASIDTPFFDKARTALGVEPQPVPPVYDPEIAATAILAASTGPIRDLIVGGSGKLLSVADLVPRLADKYMQRTLFVSQQTNTLVDDRPDNLYHRVQHDGGERGRNWTGRTKRTSVYTSVALHPERAALILASLGVLAGAVVAWRQRGQKTPLPDDRRIPPYRAEIRA